MRRGRIGIWVGTAVTVAALMMGAAGPAAAAPAQPAPAGLMAGDNPIELLQREGFFTAPGALMYRRPVDGPACIFLLDLCRQTPTREAGDPAPLHLSNGEPFTEPAGEPVTIRCRLGIYLKINIVHRPDVGDAWTLERNITRTSFLGPALCGLGQLT
jgi:hypothetical protein